MAKHMKDEYENKVNQDKYPKFSKKYNQMMKIIESN